MGIITALKNFDKFKFGTKKRKKKRRSRRK
jgi:hypothetical protein